MAIRYHEENHQITYDPPSEDILRRKSNELLVQFIKYAKHHHLASSDLLIQRSLLPRIILRVDKREGYFVVFHEQTRINEIKQAALTAYWILKFRPFAVHSSDSNKWHEFRRINEGFALFYLLSSMKRYAVLQGNTVAPLSERLVQEILYAFTYWDLSKEAIILIAETIGEAFFGIEAQGIEDQADSCEGDPAPR